MFKKFIGLLLTAAMLLSAAVVPAVSAESKSVLKNADIAEEAGLLQRLGVISNIVDEASGSEAITRAEFAVTVASALGLTGKTTKRYFIDIAENHWAVDSVNALVEFGAISQPEDRLFRPYDSITVNEAVKILLSVCGYQKYAEAIGGYPNGYIETARLLDMDVYGSAEPLTYYQSYLLLYDVLNVKMYELENGTSSSYTLSQSEDTLLSRYFDVYQTTGTVTQAQGISIYPNKFEKGNSQESASYAVIDGEIYTSDINLYDWLGRKTTVFYVQKDKDDTPNIIYRETYKKEGEILEIDADDFINYTDGSINYYENGRKKKESISDGAIVLKNGGLLNTNLEEDIKINKGMIRLVDSDEDSKFDFVFISEYENVFVNIIDADNYKLYDKIDKDKCVNLNEKSKIISIEDSQGNKKSFSDITTNEILTIYDSEAYVRVIINDASVTANVYALKTEDDKQMIEVGKSELDRKWYVIDKEYYNAYFADSGHGEVRLTIGAEITYFTDAFGNIAYISEPLKDNWGYAYLIKLSENEDTEQAIMKVLTQSGELKVYQVSSKAKVDGEKTSGFEAVKGKLNKVTNYGKSLTTGEDSVNGQVIRIKLNADNEISAVDTERVGATEDKLSMKRLTAYGDQTHWWHANGFPDAKVYYGSNTVRFSVPVYSEQQDADPKYFTVRSSKYNNQPSSTYTIESYKTDLSSVYAAAIVDYVKTSADSVETTSGAYMVNKVTRVADSNGEILNELSAYAVTTGDLVKYTADSEEAFKKGNGVLEKGDLVQLKVDSVGNTVGYVLLYDYHDKDAKTTWGHITNSGSWRESDMYYDLIHSYVKTNQDGVLRLTYSSKLAPSDMEYENINDCDRFVAFEGGGPCLIFDGKNITVTTLSQGILSAEVTGTEYAEDYWFSVFLAKIKSGVVYRDEQ